MTTRTIHFQSTDLGENLQLLLCFTPQDTLNIQGITAKPLVWKTATLPARGRCSLVATFVDAPSFCHAQVSNGARKIVSPGCYVPIHTRQETTLQIQQSPGSAVYFFSDPTSIVENSVKAVNLTGQNVNIGIGFVTDGDKPAEMMTPTSVFLDVPNGAAVQDTSTPILRAYLGVGEYQEGEIIEKDLALYQPIWEANLFSLQPNTNVVIQPRPMQIRTTDYQATQIITAATPVQSEYSAAVAATSPAVVLSPMKDTVPLVRDKLYSAVLAFPSIDQVLPTTTVIADTLQRRQYQVRLLQPEGSTEATLELTLPSTVPSLDAAEKDLLAAIDEYVHVNQGQANGVGTLNRNGVADGRSGSWNGKSIANGHGTLNGDSATVPYVEKARIQSRTGFVRNAGLARPFDWWLTVNPASKYWFVGDATSADGEQSGIVDALAPQLQKVASLANQSTSTSAIRSTEFLSHTATANRPVVVTVTKNRPLSRKSSAISLAGAY
ncbi:hypothetical protein K474DRAFT_146648 [Panus rudis PR-1116 ss-1]|nr:hypothetical protein K474DRAFT_146648 [Panus rudis PR-1116 ss-1]